MSALGAVAAAQVKTLLAKKVPIDVLNIEAADNFQSASDIKFDVGKYLSDSLFLGFSYQPGARPEKGESQYSGRLEYQISRAWTAEAWGGTAPAAGADLLWSRDY
jgi:translocation and assembly module TamB